MQYRRSGNQVLIRVDRDEEILESIRAVCASEKIYGAPFTGIGACEKAIVSSYIPEAIDGGRKGTPPTYIRAFQTLNLMSLDLPPRSFISETYHADLLALMPHIELTVLIGRYACFYSLEDRQKQNLTETVRHYVDYLSRFFPITHPSPLNQRWRRNNPWLLKETKPALDNGYPE